MEAFAGVDTHKDTHTIVIVDQLGKEVEHFSIATNSAGYAKAMELAAKYVGLIWGLEGTGSYGRPFADDLVREGHTVYEVPGKLRGGGPARTR